MSYKDKLKRLGATGLDDTHGTIRVNSSLLSPIELFYEIRDTTPLWRRRPNIVIRRLRRAQITREDELIRTQSIFKKACTKYIDPNISLRLTPRRLTNVEFHVFSLKLSGKVVTRGENAGTDGKEGKMSQWRWSACPTDDAAYDWSTVLGSADVAPSWAHEFVDDQTGTRLDKVSQSLSKLGRGLNAEVSATWETKGLGDLVWQILRLLVTGKVSLRNGYDVTVTYQFQGAQTRTFQVRSVVAVPIDGNINWKLD